MWSVRCRRAGGSAGRLRRVRSARPGRARIFAGWTLVRSDRAPPATRMTRGHDRLWGRGRWSCCVVVVGVRSWCRRDDGQTWSDRRVGPASARTRPRPGGQDRAGRGDGEPTGGRDRAFSIRPPPSAGPARPRPAGARSSREALQPRGPPRPLRRSRPHELRLVSLGDPSSRHGQTPRLTSTADSGPLPPYPDLTWLLRSASNRRSSAMATVKDWSIRAHLDQRFRSGGLSDGRHVRPLARRGRTLPGPGRTPAPAPAGCGRRRRRRGEPCAAARTGGAIRR